MQGGELVDKLLSESIGVPVYERRLGDRKTKVLVDRHPGEEDVTIRQKDEQDRRLLGLIVPTESKNEFVYLGVNEGGFVFWASDDKVGDFHPDTALSYALNYKRFGDYAATSISTKVLKDLRLTFREEDDPNRFMEMVVSAVHKERERLQSVRGRRAVVRGELLKKLFGEQG